ncbi:uncharacterized protein FIBRA_02827 [Fibroporia radiculosa]|uniref:Uncharacterized protein n=1 Tax=Fibroporia radiculosa TaxID=599839 RepID=J4GN52_9APHY|nr:uncharacterized protein FIBRA_02827 [Fibroporia radiculosa]CCM00785.1 predicted protein [Fibroporia radiculosa]
MALASVGVSGAPGRRADSQATCNSGEVISTSTLMAGSVSLKVVTETCPGLTTSSPSSDAFRLDNGTVVIDNVDVRSPSSKRQTAISGTCDIQCMDIGTAADMSDCSIIENELNGIDGYFTAYPATRTTFSFQTCALNFINAIDEELSVYYPTIGTISGDVASDCLSGDMGSEGGECQEIPGLDWVFGAYGVTDM